MATPAGLLTTVAVVLPLCVACTSPPSAGEQETSSAPNDAAAGTVTPVATMTVDRAAHSATLLADGRVLLVGGIRSGEVGLDTAELFDPARGRFEPTGLLGAVRGGGHAVVRLRDGRVLVAGGWAEDNVARTAELYEPDTGEFHPTGSMAVPRTDAAAALLPDGRVLLAGGFDGSTAVDSAEIYDPDIGSFTPAGRLSAARSSVATAGLDDGRVLLVGGQGANGDVLASAETYDPSTGEFAPTGSLASVRYKAASVPLTDGTVLVLGGSDERDWDGQYDSAEIYDPDTGEFGPASDMNRMRFKITAAVAGLADGRILVAGSDPRVEVYDPASGLFELTAGGLGSEYQFATATALPDGRALIAGGYDSAIQPTANAWIYRP